MLRFTNAGVWVRGELNRTLRLGDRHLFLLGLDTQRDVRQNFGQQGLEPESPPVDKLSTSGTRLGLYASDDIKLAPHWRLGLGARLDRDASDRWTATPRLSLLWRPPIRCR